jgi:uncharacterized coiled-coil DUF342 family protein
MKEELLDRMLDALEAYNECKASLEELLAEAATMETEDPELNRKVDAVRAHCEELSNQYIDAYRAYSRHQARID